MLLAGAAGPSRQAASPTARASRDCTVILLSSDHIGFPRDWEIGIGIAVLRLDHGSPNVHCAGSEPVGRIMIIAANGCDHLARQSNGQLDHVRRPAALQHLDRFCNLQGVSSQ